MTVLLLLVAGVAAGLSGSIAGLASLFSYPALLAVGLPATTANVTNTVALAFSTVGQVAGSRPELSGQWPVLRRLAPLTLLGGATGAGLLLVTPSEAFERIVPFLVGGAALVLLFQPRIRAVAARRGSSEAGPAVLGGMFVVAVYGGYFGAAAGVLMLALVLIGLPVGLARGNALKAVLLGVANAVAAVGFAVLGVVAWWAVPPLAIGVAIGGWCGPWVVRRLPAGPLRVGIALAGLGLAVWLAVQAY
ncbi:sulfite exporter TauE/SafE family protein [Pseudonocardia sp. KRD-184]|uniref:Probable membrane transporter protein n=1 Tax=Pseudonocardia oceani TaxID=2792013 RepID=A0ABS6UEM7_9PSEU|nr:sulfite exporter TauE/SafE family protein [Pseudonocardia oceani]MBW0093669.1 sulfite exporter TauE/SafE family protein [Pseudonocardia oceani]MBW0100350.1 sulfite exporter TauE/SafE family protein [Pseudonocardia oceani]MBW0122164.1 sulfite exporter TauE/SafE family protein [Pseudonocardia oceani]MBW0130376.1 sulfite exporter TauE/SafE family protein [Pseudonocardia oceani]